MNFLSLERRYLSDLTFQEVVRALRALSSCYVERRRKLAEGGALDSKGKRAAFALFYGPLHFLVITQIVRALDGARDGIRDIVDVGCGTGLAGAAWALEAGTRRVSGIDRTAWAVMEANWTYRELKLNGRAIRGDAGRFRVRAGAGTGVLVAYTTNELTDSARTRLLDELKRADDRGASVLVVEPIARRMAPWWNAWTAAFLTTGGRADEWRFPGDIPALQRDLGRAAGLDLHELTARSLWLDGRSHVAPRT